MGQFTFVSKVPDSVVFFCIFLFMEAVDLFFKKQILFNYDCFSPIAIWVGTFHLGGLTVCVLYFHVSKQWYGYQCWGFLMCAEILMCMIAHRCCMNTKIVCTERINVPFIATQNKRVHLSQSSGSWDSLLAECQTCDPKVASLNPSRNGGRIFFSELTLCVDSYSLSVLSPCYRSGM